MGTVHQNHHERAREITRKVLDEVEDIPILRGQLKIGGEQMVPDSGGVMYFRHDRVYVEGNMNDMATLRVISKLCDEYDLEVDSYRGHQFCSDEHAILRVRHQD